MISGTLRVILGFATGVYFIVVLLLLKRKSLTLKYTLLWLIAGSCMGVLVAFPLLLRRFTHILGIASEMNGLFSIGLGCIISILMALTSIVSTQNAKIRRLTQNIAYMEQRLRDLEKDI